MAERRMFAKTIIDSDAFLDMPLSTQALYFHLCMRADDEGFVNKPKMIQRMIGSNDDDMKVLFSKKFLISFDSGVVVVKHWMIHNYIRKDRLVETMYKVEKEALTIDENGAYTFNKLLEISADQELSATELRKKAYSESSLPYSFDYKIKQAFYHEKCPICGCKMELGEFGIRNRIPSVQHNIPISRGGKHELDNISVICLSCNTSTRDNITESLNNEEVIKKWDEICSKNICQSNDGQVTDKCQHRLGKDRLGKDSIDKDKKEKKLANAQTYFPNDEKLNSTFLDFMQMRKSLKNGKMTERAITMMINKLNKYDNDTAIAMLNQSIINNWKDIYEPKTKGQQQSSKGIDWSKV